MPATPPSAVSCQGTHGPTSPLSLTTVFIKFSKSLKLPKRSDNSWTVPQPTLSSIFHAGTKPVVSWGVVEGKVPFPVGSVSLLEQPLPLLLSIPAPL